MLKDVVYHFKHLLAIYMKGELFRSSVHFKIRCVFYIVFCKLNFHFYFW